MDVIHRIKILAYRVGRKICTVNANHFFGIECSQVSGPECPADLTFTPLTKNSLSRLDTGHMDADGMNTGENCESFQSFVDRLEGGNALGIGVIDENRIIAYSWIATGEISAKDNHDGDPSTGLPISLPMDTVYLFNAFVEPEHRGKRLYAIMMRYLAEMLMEKGYSKILLTTEVTNKAALIAVRRMGFESVGVSRLLCFGPFLWSRYPTQPMFGGVRVGRYVGDWRKPINTRQKIAA